jgi:hypothetical protein
MTMEMLELKDGSRVAEPTVRTTLLTLQAVRDAHPLALFEAVQIARDPGHEPFGNLGSVLSGYGLIDADGTMHDDTRHVVLSAARGSALDLTLANPVKGQ